MNHIEQLEKLTKEVEELNKKFSVLLEILGVSLQQKISTFFTPLPATDKTFPSPYEYQSTFQGYDDCVISRYFKQNPNANSVNIYCNCKQCSSM